MHTVFLIKNVSVCYHWCLRSRAHRHPCLVGRQLRPLAAAVLSRRRCCHIRRRPPLLAVAAFIAQRRRRLSGSVASRLVLKPQQLPSGRRVVVVRGRGGQAGLHPDLVVMDTYVRVICLVKEEIKAMNCKLQLKASVHA